MITSQNGGQTSGISKTEPKPVECALCHRKFKNIPALNGHMRLHGGYFKKVCVFCLLTFFLLMPRRNEAFRTNLFPHIPESCWSFIRFPFTSLLRIFTLFGSSTQFHPLEQESGHSRRLERVLGSLSPYVGTDLFLSKRIELPPFPGFEPMTPNSVRTRAPPRHPS